MRDDQAYNRGFSYGTWLFHAGTEFSNLREAAAKQLNERFSNLTSEQRVWFYMGAGAGFAIAQSRHPYERE